MTVGPDGARMRAMTSADLPAVLAIENASQPTPWSEGNFRDCLQGAYRCRVAAVDGEPVASVEDIVSYFNTMKPGNRVRLSVFRDERVIEVEVALTEWPDT